jgi:hypothetical protein
VISLVAHLRTAPGVGSAALRDVSAHLRGFDHVFCAPGQYLVTLPAGTALVDESRTGLLVDIVVATEDAAARACATLAHEIAASVGESTVMVSWKRRALAASPR